jgi:hypothetical protein
VQDILLIGGIDSIFTERNGTKIPGVSLLGFNPVYSASNEDINLHIQNIKLPFFKIPYWSKVGEVFSHIKIISPEILTAGEKEF